MKKIFLLVLFVLIIPSLGGAATYYVRTDGHNTSCNGSANASVDSAPNCSFRTVQKGVDTATAAGSVVSIQAGNYDEFVYTKASGTDGNYITLVSTGGYARVLYIAVEHKYLIIDGFEVTGSSGMNFGIRINRVSASVPCEYITIQNCYFHDIPSATYTIAYYLSPYPNYITIDKNIFGAGLYIGIAIYGNPTGYSHHWTITNNTWNEFKGDSIRLYGKDHYVANNLMKFHQPEPTGSHTDAFMQSDSDATHILQDTILENNKIMYGRAQIGNLSDDGANNVTNLTFRNNVIYGMSSPFNFSAVNTAWYNNTIIFSSQFSTNHPILALGSGYNNLTFKNNAFVSNSGPSGPAHGYFDIPDGKTIIANNNLYAKYSPTYAGFAARASETGVQNGVDPKFKNAPKALTNPVWKGDIYDCNMELTTNPRWLNCTTAECGTGAIAPTLNAKNTDLAYVRSGARSLHVTGNANSGVFRKGAWIPRAYYNISIYVYVVSGTVRLKAYQGGVTGWQTLASTSTTGSWVQLQGTMLIDWWGYFGAPIAVDTTSDGAEFYIDDHVVTIIGGNATNAFQYWKEYESLFTVGEYIEIDDDGVAREITAKDTDANTITFSPSRSTVIGDIFHVVELWGSNNTNLTLDLAPLDDTSPLYNTGADLSGVWANATDIRGNARGLGGAWDIGAYEYVTGEPPAPPVISVVFPNVSLNCTDNPRTANLQLVTDENATCKFNSSDTTFALMSGTYANTGGKVHSQDESVACGTSVVYYSRCSDMLGNVNTSSVTASFSVGSVPVTITPFTGSITLGTGKGTMTLK